MAGATAPVTLAGFLAVLNAEVLAGVTLAQLVCPGNPVLYGSFAGVMEMRSGMHLLASPEFALLTAATAQLYRFYALPFGYATGGHTDSATLGQRAAMEKMATVLLPALAGVDLIHNGACGLIEPGNTLDFGQMLIDNELCSYVGRILDGITVNPEHIALDVIQEVGPGGKILTDAYTARNLRKELCLSRFWDAEKGDSIRHTMTRLRERARTLASKEPEDSLDPQKSEETTKVTAFATTGKI